MVAKLTTELFVSKARDIHGDKYDYSLVNYTTNKARVKINCPVHGEYEQEPRNHLNGNGCPKCGRESKAKSAKVAAEFASRAKEVHNNKYDYSLVEYTHSKTKVRILCPIHGIFEQRPDNHLLGIGCIHCANEASGWTRTKFKEKCIKNNNGLGILYILECFNDDERFIKIGITSNSIKKRYKSKSEMPYAYRVIDEIIGAPEFIYDLETKMHRQHKEHQYSPKIYFYGSSTECFKTYLTNKQGDQNANSTL